MLEIRINPNFVSICLNLILRPYNLFNILFLIKLNNKQFMAFIEILENIFGHFKFLQRGLKPNSTFVVGCVICRHRRCANLLPIDHMSLLPVPLLIKGGGPSVLTVSSLRSCQMRCCKSSGHN